MGRAGYIAVRPNNKKKDYFNLDFNGRSFWIFWLYSIILANSKLIKKKYYKRSLNDKKSLLIINNYFNIIK